MLLAIDIGNTNITFGIFKGKKLIRNFDIPTKAYSLKKLGKLLGKIPLTHSIICSVVPKTTKIINQDLKKLIGKHPLIVGHNLNVPMKNLYRNPKQLGADRLVNAYAAAKLYGAPAIIIDFGTAISFDIVSKNNIYLGGIILPGLNTCLEALNSKTALLPRIKLDQPKSLIGRSTKEGILSGIVYGFASLTDSLTKTIRTKIGNKSRIIATGGDAKLIAKYCKSINLIDRNLTLKGLQELGCFT